MQRLKNKIAIITGAASGIGAAIVAMFREEGAIVIATDLSYAKDRLFNENLPHNEYQTRLDVTVDNEWQQVEHLIAQQFGGYDILINNAGICGLANEFGDQNPELIDLATWQMVQKTNVESVVLGCKHAIATMKSRQSGAIVNISSLLSQKGAPPISAYAASKAAVANYSKSVALYCAEKHYPIRCNSVHPGIILTPMWDTFLSHEERERKIRVRLTTAKVPMHRFGLPAEVASMVLFLASDEASYITGSEMNIDGGLSAV